jgi:hypothetical protein
MIVEIDARRFATSTVPTENKSPLSVDPDGMQSGQIAAQLLEMVAGRHPQILVGHGIVNHLMLPKHPVFQISWNIPRSYISDKEIPQPSIVAAYCPLLWSESDLCCFQRSGALDPLAAA